jgi:hypothetical protein
MKVLKHPAKGVERVNVTMFRNGWCQTMNISCERAKRACLEFPGKINLREFDTVENREIIKEWGITDSLYIDGKEVWVGPPPSYEKIKRKIEKRVNRLK